MPQSHLPTPPHCDFFFFFTEEENIFFSKNDLKGFCFLIYRIKFTKLNFRRLVCLQS